MQTSVGAVDDIDEPAIVGGDVVRLDDAPANVWTALVRPAPIIGIGSDRWDRIHVPPQRGCAHARPRLGGDRREMLERLTSNARAAAAVFMTEDPRAARQLLGEKEVFRDLEARATEAHFGRDRADRAESIETSTLHLDILRDLKRVNAHLAAAAYPILEGRGELLPSRLKQDV